MDELVKRATKVPKQEAPAPATGAGAGAGAVVPTNANQEFISEALLRPIREKCRSDDFYIREVARYLLLNLQHKAWLVRIRTLNVIDALFVRSHLFRELICADIRAVCDTGGLLGTSSAAAARNSVRARTGPERVSSRVKELLELWDLQYGNTLPSLRATARYLRESLRVQMPNLTRRAQERAVHAATALATQMRLLAIHRDRVLSEASAGIDAIVEDVQRMDDYFAILFPAVADVAPATSLLPLPLPLPAAARTVGTELPRTRKRKLAISIEPRIKATFADAERDPGLEAESEPEALGESDRDGDGGCAAGDEDKDEDADEDGEGITWEDAEEEEKEEQKPQAPPPPPELVLPAAPLSATEARSLMAAVPPSGVVLSTQATSAALLRSAHNEDILTAVRDHTLHLSRSVLPRVRGWMDVLVRAQGRPDPDANPVVQHAADMMLRRIALLNARLYRILTSNGKFFNENFLSPNASRGEIVAEEVFA